MTVKVHFDQNGASVRRVKSCPPHGPHLVEAIEGGRYVARCLACGLAGPVREDGLQAKLAFDQGWH
jgi:hypothetical protein